MPKEKQVIRKLSAILSANIKSYGLLMVDDEANTRTIVACNIYGGGKL